MKNKDSIITKLAFLSVSLLLTNAYSIQGALPQLKQTLSITQTQAEYLVTTPSFTVTLFVLLSPLIQRHFKISDKNIILTGVLIVGITGAIPMFINNYPLILVSRLLLGAGYGLYNSQAISLISVWYAGNERAQLLGWRASAEQIGQALGMFLSGLFLSMAGWHASFGIYLLSFLVLVFFAIKVPNDKPASTEEDQADDSDTVVSNGITKISPVVYLLVLLAFILIVNYVGIENRYPSLAAVIKGTNYTGSSMFLSLMLIGATLGGIFYGPIHQRLGFATIYLGLALMAVANFLFGFAGHNYVMMVAGLLLMGFPLQLVSPLVFNLLPDLAPSDRQAFVTSLCLIGFNFGAFFSPSIGELVNNMMGKPLSGLGLAAPFPVYGILLLLIAVGIYVAKRAKTK